jgi:hypothetical protein
MNKNLVSLLIGLMVILSTLPAFAADDDSMRLEIGYFQPTLTFNARYASNGVTTNDVDFKNDFGFSNRNAAEYRLWINDNLRLSYTNWSFSGSKMLTENITYGGTTYSTNTLASASLGVDYYRLTWLRPISQAPALETNWLIDIKGFSFKTNVTGTNVSTNTTVTENKNFAGAIPTFGLRAVIKPDGWTGVSCFGEISGLPLGKYGHFYDMEIGVKYDFAKSAAASLAYRSFDLNINDGSSNGDKAELKQAGPYFQVGYKF